MKPKKQTQTATVKEMRTLANACKEHAHTCAVASAKCTDYTIRVEQMFGYIKDYNEKSRIHSDAAREHHTRTAQHAENAYNSANRAGEAADDASSYATTAKLCMIATQIALAAVLIISLCN